MDELLVITIRLPMFSSSVVQLLLAAIALIAGVRAVMSLVKKIPFL